LENESSNEHKFTEEAQNSSEPVPEVNEGLIGPGGIYYILGGLILGILLGAVIAYAKE